MTRRKQSRLKLQISPKVFKILFEIFFCAAILVLIYIGAKYLLENTEYFKIKSIAVDPALENFDSGDLIKLRGRNIFKIDLMSIESQLARRNPDAAHLRVIRDFPDSLRIEARKRMPFAQSRINNKVFIFDIRAVVLSEISSEDRVLPVIIGLVTNEQSPALGHILDNKELKTALRVLQIFKSNKLMSGHFISKIDVSNLSDIKIYLENELQVVLDDLDVEKKIKVLSLLFARSEIDFSKINYIDLRFNDPIIKDKEENKNSKSKKQKR